MRSHIAAAGRRLHSALMPDYNRLATSYWWLVVLLGFCCIAWATLQVSTMGAAAGAQLLVSVVLAIAVGLVPLKVPGTKVVFAAGEIFIFFALVQLGVGAGVLAAAAEAAAASARTSKRWTSRLASPAMAALSMALIGGLLQPLLGSASSASPSSTWVLAGACLASIGHFVVTTSLMTLMYSAKQGRRPQLLQVLHQHVWYAMAVAGSASVAALLVITVREEGLVAMLAAVPLIAMLILAAHYYFRHLESAEQARREREAAQQREAEQQRMHLAALQTSERRFQSAFTHAAIGMALVSFDGRVSMANVALARLFGPGGAAAGDVPEQLSQWFGAEESAQLQAGLQRLQHHLDTRVAMELHILHPDGRQIAVAVDCSFFGDATSPDSSFILQVRDVSAQRRAQADLHHQAFHDSLTGLPNRRRFHDLLAQAVQRVRAHPEEAFQVLFLDFDRFKLINDSLGHRIGDQFLVAVAERIAAHLRPRDAVARLGGDEFAVLAWLEGPDAVLPRALPRRLLDVLSQPVRVEATEITTTVSIGITSSHVGYESAEQILRDADIAMYRAKGQGKGRFEVFDMALREAVSERVALERDLRKALDRDGLEVAYQPLFDLRDGRLLGFEALARWHDPVRGTVSPATFIPVAEESGTICRITDVVLQRACRQLQDWRQQFPGWAALGVHVNLATLDLAQPMLLARVADKLCRTGLPAHCLTLELTENILMEHLSAALGTLDALRRLGVSLAVDDFGTGYSSLAHLSSLPIDSLKIDGSFVNGIEGDTRRAAVVRSIVLLGQSLGKTVVAEGIETAEQGRQLAELGCDVGQGFHLGRPMSAEQAEALLRQLPAPAPAAPAAGQRHVIPLPVAGRPSRWRA